MTELSMEINGMTCGHCVKAVRDALDAVPGVEVETVAIGSATVRFDEQQLDRARITQAVVDEGYEVTAAH
jgi:copper chaperone CopZ